MLHVIGARCVARDLHTIATEPLECTCWRRFSNYVFECDYYRYYYLGHWILRYWSYQGPVSWRPTTVKWRQFSQSNRHSTIGTRQAEYHEALPSSANVQWHLTSSFADDGNASWYSVCQVPMVGRRLDCENRCHLTVVGLPRAYGKRGTGSCGTPVVGPWGKSWVRRTVLSHPEFHPLLDTTLLRGVV